MSIEVNATEQIISVNATGSTIDINVASQTVDVNATTSVIEVTASYNPGINLPNGGTTGQVLKKQSNTDYDTYWAADEKGVPYIGATGDVDLGEYEIKAGQFELDQSPTGTAGVAVTRWNNTIGSTETTLKGGSVVLKNGVDLIARVVNKVTPNTTLTKAAYQAVRISGAQGQRLAVALAQANNDNNSADTIGLVTETIATNQEGFIMTVGNLENINTTGSLQGETWVDGDVLYLSPTIAGVITNVKPVAPQHLVIIGYVEYAHANNGKIYVKTMNGYELGELHDVNTTGATNGQVLKYNGTIWTPSSDIDTGITSLNSLTALTQTFATGSTGTDFNISSATSTHTFNIPTASATNRGFLSSGDWSIFNGKQDALGFTAVPNTRTLTINGTAYDLSADRSWTVSGTNIYTADGTLAGDRIVTNSTFLLKFVGGKEILTNEQTALRLETSTTGKELIFSLNNLSGKNYLLRSLQSGTFDIRNITDGTTVLSINSSFVATFFGVIKCSGNTTIGNNSSIPGIWFNKATPSTSNYSLYAEATATYINGAGGGIWFRNNNANQGVLTSAGRLLLGTTTEATYLLDVNGTARIAGTLRQTQGGNNYIDIVANANASSPYIDLFYSGTQAARLNSYATISGSSFVNQNGFLIGDTAGAGLTTYVRDLYAHRSIEIKGTTSGKLYFTSTGDNAISFFVPSVAYRGILGFASGTSYFQIRTNGATNFTDGTLSTIFDINGSVGIGGITSINASAILQADSTTKGFLPPRMTETQKNAISTPATGLVIYQTDGTEGLYERTSSAWRLINASGGGSGTVTSVSVVSANGFAGTVATSTTTPAITLTTTVTGLLKGNGTAISAAVAGTDYLTTAITSLNSLTGASQTFATGTAGTDFTITSTGTTHTFDIPSASATARGLITTGTQTIAGAKTFSSTPIITATTGLNFTSGGFTGTIRFAGVEPTGTRAFDIVYPTNGGFRFGVSGADGPLFQAWGGTDPSFAGQMYFDYGSFTRNVANRAAYFRNQSTSTVTTVMSLFASSNVGIGSTTDNGFKFEVTGTSRLSGAATMTSTVTMSGISSTTTANVLYFNSSTGAVTYGAVPSGSGGITRSVNNISTTTTAGATASTDYVYLISGTTTLTLPTAVGNTNRYTLKNVGTNTVTINTTSSQTIDGSTSITMAVQYTALDVISDGTNWNII